MMRRYSCTRDLCAVVFAGIAAVANSALFAAETLPLVPWPKQVKIAKDAEVFTATGRILTLEKELAPLTEVLASEIELIYDINLSTAEAPAVRGDITLSIDPKLAVEEYRLTIADQVSIVGGGYQGVAWGTVTLLQALENKSGKLVAPAMSVEDKPTAEFRGLLVDVARETHSLELLKLLVTMCRFYKINYVQLHLTDGEAFTFPSTAYPKLATKRRHFTLEELRDLVQYAKDRGVAIIPELEVPGHASAMAGAMPELFGSLDENGKPRSLGGCLNMANEAVYPALETIVKEMCEVFYTSPYFHIGADEVWLEEIKKIPEWQTYKQKHNLKTDHDVYYHCINRMHDIVKNQNRKTLVWEGFNDHGNVKIPKDIVVMIFENAYFPADRAAAVGYTLINTSWQPIYVVNKKSWSASAIYAWNYFLWKTVNDTSPPTEGTQLSQDAPILGAMMCAWEQKETIQISTLRPRLPAMSERVWNPGADRSYADYEDRYRRADALLARIVSPISINQEGLVAIIDRPPNANLFHNPLKVTIASSVPGEIRYTLDGVDPTTESPLYNGPIELKKSAAVKARAYDAQHRPRGYIDWCEYTQITPALTYQYFDAPADGWKEMPDFSTLKPTSQGLLDKFRSFGLTRNYAVTMEGRTELPATGEYEFRVRLSDAEAILTLGDTKVFDFNQAKSGKPWWEHFDFNVHLEKGTVPVKWEYLAQTVNGFVEVQVKSPGSEKFQELTLLPLDPALSAATPSELSFK